MQKLIALVALLLGVSAGGASADGINLAWSQCPADGGTPCRAFACDTNAGADVINGSFVLSTMMQSVSGMEIVLDLYFSGGGVPEWWRFKNAGSCRLNSLTMSNAESPNSVCFDWSSGHSVSAVASYQVGVGGYPDWARLVLIAAVPVLNLAELLPDFEYNAFRLTLDHANTVGSSCTGCLAGVGIVFHHVLVTTSGNANNRFLSTPLSPGSNLIGWQNDPVLYCPAPVPTRNVTWGRVKALYR